MNIKQILFSFCFLLSFSFATSAGAWYEGVINGVDVYDTDSAAGTWATVQTTCGALGADVRLPNFAELELMYMNKASLGSFNDASNNDYWSSTSSSSVNAFVVDFLDGSTDNIVKTATEDVRCVRDASPYVESSITGMRTEFNNMLDEYLPAILLIFATLFALGYFAHLVRKWIGGRK